MKKPTGICINTDCKNIDLHLAKPCNMYGGHSILSMHTRAKQNLYNGLHNYG